MRLFEIFTTTRKIRWKNTGDFGEARFRTDDGNEYRINFYPEPLKTLKYTARNMPDVLETLNKIDDDAQITRVEFSLESPMGNDMTDTKYGRTGTGNQYTVFATVIATIKEFTQTHNYNHIRIVAEEPNRQRLYRRMIKSMPHKNVYVNTDEMGGQEAYIIEL